MSYKSTRRQWVKLWVNEWLDGTTRFELTAAQRVLWIDLLALAGRSRFPGFIYAGAAEGGRRVGYPVAYLAGVLQMDEISLNNTLKLLLDKGHITLEESAPEQYIIGIVNWEKYQSEYFRQKGYRKVTPKVTTQTTSRLPVEGEGEVEGEVEVKTIVQPKALDVPFEFFWEIYPRKEGKAKAQLRWKHLTNPLRRAAIEGVGRWSASGRWHDRQFVPHAATYLNGRRWEDEITPSGRQDAHVGQGPMTPDGPFCSQCGYSKFFHTKLPENRKRFNPADDGHAFVEAGQAVSA